MNEKIFTPLLRVGPGKAITDMLYLRDQVWSCLSDSSIFIWNWHKGRAEVHLSGLESTAPSRLANTQGYVWSQSKDGTQILWKPLVWISLERCLI